MKYAFFPGCVLEGAAKEAFIATSKVSRILGIELQDIPGWSCCGASHAQEVDEWGITAINARNIALAEQMHLPLLTVCNTCTLMLRKTKFQLDNNLPMKQKINNILSKAKINYQGTSEVTHLLWVILQEYGLERLKSKITKPLTNLKVAEYYGCHILRPPEIMSFEDYANPSSLKNLITALGAQVVNFEHRLQCCGFHASYTAAHDVTFITGKINNSAIKAGADCIVTPCPLCQMSLDINQPEGQTAVGCNQDIPILHLAQLIGLALGLQAKDLAIDMHIAGRDKFGG